MLAPLAMLAHVQGTVFILTYGRNVQMAVYLYPGALRKQQT